jgi:hypothetical protein
MEKFRRFQTPWIGRRFEVQPQEPQTYPLDGVQARRPGWMGPVLRQKIGGATRRLGGTDEMC